MNGRREVGLGVPAVEWTARRYDQYGEYEGHTFVTADPKGMARSVCDGFADDMDHIVRVHNALLGYGWRARLARWLLNEPVEADQ